MLRMSLKQNQKVRIEINGQVGWVVFDSVHRGIKTVNVGFEAPKHWNIVREPMEERKDGSV